MQELTREQERVKRTEKLLKEEHERGNSLLTRVKDLEIQNSSLRYQSSTNTHDLNISLFKTLSLTFHRLIFNFFHHISSLCQPQPQLLLRHFKKHIPCAKKPRKPLTRMSPDRRYQRERWRDRVTWTTPTRRVQRSGSYEDWSGTPSILLLKILLLTAPSCSWRYVLGFWWHISWFLLSCWVADQYTSSVCSKLRAPSLNR